MRPGAKMGAMGNGRLLPNDDRSQIVNECFLPDGAPVARDKVPGHINLGCIVNMHVCSHFRAKEPQQKTAPAETRARTPAEKNPSGRPENASHHLRPGVFPRLAIGFYI